MSKITLPLSILCTLLSVTAYATGNQVIKEWTTPPAYEEALSVKDIPPLYSDVTKAAPAQAAEKQ